MITGFTVETPEAEIIDFGTEFSVDVKSTTSEAHPVGITLATDQFGRDQSSGPGISNDSTTPLWTSGKQTRGGNFKANKFFEDLTIRVVDAAEAGK